MELYSFLETLELRQQHIRSSALITTSINGSRDVYENANLNQKVVSEQPEASMKQNSIKSLKYQKYILPGTGRIAFGSHSDVGEIYHYHSSSGVKGSNIPKSVNPSDDKYLDLEEVQFESLSLNNKTEDMKSKDSCVEVNPTAASSGSSPSTSSSLSRKNKKSDSFDVSSEASKIKKKPNLSKTGSTVEASAKHGDKRNTQKVKQITDSAPLPTTTKTNPYGLPPPRTKPFVNNSNSVPVVGVGQTTGKVAAMARMKALGEEWPEEEELPGFALPSSSLVSSAGLPSKDVTKEANKSLHRQQKLNVAKRKG
jgi:hypothetical protein